MVDDDVIFPEAENCEAGASDAIGGLLFLKRKLEAFELVRCIQGLEAIVQPDHCRCVVFSFDDDGCEPDIDP